MPYAEKRDGKLTGRWISEFRGRFPKRAFETRKEGAGYEAYVKATGMEPENLKDTKLAGPTFKDAVVLMRSKKKAGRDPSGDRRLDLIVGRLGHLTLAAITTTELDTLVEWLEKRPAQIRGKQYISDSTINRYLSAISGVFTWTQDRDRDLKPPVFPWRCEDGKRIHWFTENQEDALVRLLEDQAWLSEALALRVLCATGLRWGEFMGLEAHQCQPEWILLDATKTDTPRDVPIDADLGRSLKALVVTGTVPNYYNMRIRLKAAIEACGYSAKLGIHNTRHTTATRLIKKGVALPIVQQFLGHMDIKTTMKYVHVENADLMDASKKLYPRRGELSENGGGSQVLPFVKSAG